MTSPEASAIVWKPGDPVPSELSGCPYVVRSSITPRLLAWISTDDSSVSLLDGYNAMCYSPPTLMFASSALPQTLLRQLQSTRRCTLSAVTSREPRETVLRAMMSKRGSPDVYSFPDLNLVSTKNKSDYPVAIAGSPVHMYCSLHDIVELTDDDALVLLTVETFVVNGSVLSAPTEEMKRDRASVTAKIDAQLIQPWVGLGNGQVSLLAALADMPRPAKTEQGLWHSEDLLPLPSDVAESDSITYDTIEWSFRTDGRECSLGYNPVTALIMPRPIGWISTFRKEGRVPHVAPYSFFCDVARGEMPMVAFSGYRPNGEGRKDAQQDAEDMECFACNLVTEDLAVPMNNSAAPLSSHESEFELAGLEQESALTIDAPLVAKARIKLECVYHRTVDVPETSFSIVIGRITAVHLDRQCIHGGVVDPLLLRPITRLGYTNEYGLLSPK